MLLRKASGDRDRFAIRQQKASQRQWHQIRDVRKVDSGKADIGQTERQIADDLYTGRAQMKDARHYDRRDHNDQRRRSAGKRPLKRNKQGDRGNAKNKRR